MAQCHRTCQAEHHMAAIGKCTRPCTGTWTTIERRRRLAGRQHTILPLGAITSLSCSLRDRRKDRTWQLRMCFSTTSHVSNLCQLHVKGGQRQDPLKVRQNMTTMVFIQALLRSHQSEDLLLKPFGLHVHCLFTSLGLLPIHY